MALTIELLGVPRVSIAGAPVPAPPGRKAWALLAYLVLTRGPVPRERLAAFFEEADDPLATLRWNLNALRRLLGPAALARGGCVELALPPATWVDVDVVLSGSWSAALAVPALDAELLEGMSFSTSPTLELWISGQRRQLAGAAEAVLHEAALARLAAGEADGAAELAERLVRLNPFDENFNALLVRCLSSGGRGVDAARHAARCRELFVRELGRQPGPALDDALRTPSRAAASRSLGGPSSVRAQLQAGRAALAAGAADAGIQCLRRAVSEASAARAADLHAEALVTLGAGLVHSVRGADEEGAAVLHEGLQAAERHGVDALAAEACRELGYVDFLRARYDRGRRWLARAEELAAEDDAQLGRIRCIAGSIATDVADYEQAFRDLAAASQAARGTGDHRQLAYVESMAGRARLLHGDLDAARVALDASIALAGEAGWTALTPWPQSFRAECDLLDGDVERAAIRLEDAFALGCELGDPCWEAVAARGLGRVADARGDADTALRWFASGEERLVRLPDAYVWAHAYVLDAACTAATGHRSPLARGLVQRLQDLADRSGMRDLSARAQDHERALDHPLSALQAGTPSRGFAFTDPMGEDRVRRP